MYLNVFDFMKSVALRIFSIETYTKALGQSLLGILFNKNMNHESSI